MNAVVIGPGRIGCGLAGPLLNESGAEIVFVGRRPDVVAHFERVGRYIVRLVDGTITTETVVEHVRALWSEDVDRVADEIARADVVITAVGGGNLARSLLLSLKDSGGARRPSTSSHSRTLEKPATCCGRTWRHSSRKTSSGCMVSPASWSIAS